jgi:SAM-dependent methyltransferase
LVAPTGRGTGPVYDTIGQHYTTYRQTDPRWQAVITANLGDARTVCNVGAGTGSYEPTTARVVAVEPSPVMLAQRAPDAAPAVRGSGTAIPLASDSVHAVMAILTIHHWVDWRAGLAELARVAPRRLVLTIDFEAHAAFWLLADYLPEVAEVERRLRPTPGDVVAAFGEPTEIIELPLPPDLADGVLGSFWRQPEAYLDPVVRANTSPLALADPAHIARGVGQLEADLASGAWQRRHGHLLERDSLDLGYRLVVSC